VPPIFYSFYYVRCNMGRASFITFFDAQRIFLRCQFQLLIWAKSLLPGTMRLGVAREYQYIKRKFTTCTQKDN